MATSYKFSQMMRLLYPSCNFSAPFCDLEISEIFKNYLHFLLYFIFATFEKFILRNLKLILCHTTVANWHFSMPDFTKLAFFKSI